MIILRKLFVGLLAFILPLCLLGLAWSFTGSSTIGNREAVVGWVEDSGAYDKSVDALLESIKRGQQEGEGEEVVPAEGIPIDDPQIQAIAKQAFSSEFLKTNFENFINGIYDYLEDKSASPTFQINVGEVKTQLANGLTSYVTERTRNLPVCSRSELPDELDVYNATCLPPGTTPEQAGQVAANEILNNPDFLPKQTYTADDIKFKDKNGQEVPLSQSEQLKSIKQSYNLSRALPIIFTVISLLLAAGVILLTPEKQQGFKRVAKILFGAAVTLGISYFLLDRGSAWLSERLKNQDLKSSGEILAVIGDIIKTAAQDAAKYLLWFAIGYVVIGISIFVIIKLMNRETPAKEPAPGSIVPDSEKSKIVSETESKEKAIDKPTTKAS